MFRPDAERLRSILDTSAADPISAPVSAAAVAAVFRPGEVGTEILFIQRASREGDPWSGQMAFPGGRTEEGDPTFAATAERETLEEVGLDLRAAEAERLGALSPLDGGRANNRLTLVQAHAYWLTADIGPPRPNEEVADALWVPVGELTNPSRHIDYFYPLAGATFPGIQLDNQEQVIWGLTLRFLGDLFRRLNYPFII